MASRRTGRYAQDDRSKKQGFEDTPWKEAQGRQEAAAIARRRNRSLAPQGWRPSSRRPRSVTYCSGVDDDEVPAGPRCLELEPVPRHPRPLLDDAARRPTIRLTSVDLPTFGRPATTTTGSPPVSPLPRAPALPGSPDRPAHGYHAGPRRRGPPSRATRERPVERAPVLGDKFHRTRKLLGPASVGGTGRSTGTPRARGSRLPCLPFSYVFVEPIYIQYTYPYIFRSVHKYGSHYFI